MERAIKALVDGRYAWTDLHVGQRRSAPSGRSSPSTAWTPAHFGGVKIACIGEATAGRVRAFGIQPELVPAGEQSARACSRSSAARRVLDPVGRVLLPRADIATETLAAGLTSAAGRSTTSPPTGPCGPRRRRPRSATRSSRRLRRGALHLVLDGAQPGRHRRQAARRDGGRGDRPKTAETAVEFGLRVDVQPPHASVPDLVEALAGYAVELREKLAAMPAKQRAGSKVQGRRRYASARSLGGAMYPGTAARCGARRAAAAGRGDPVARPSWSCRCSSGRG
jgi:uroporphyrinogen III methyltransferase/synthase